MKSYRVCFPGHSSSIKISKAMYLKYMALVGLSHNIPINFEHELLIGVIDINGPYYMRDNHTFKLLSGSVDNMINQIKAEHDAGYKHGMLCAHDKREVVHFSGQFTEEKVVKAKIWLISYLGEGEQNEDNCNS